MNKKEVTTKEDLLAVISILENAGITYWIDGGWGIYRIMPIVCVTFYI